MPLKEHEVRTARPRERAHKLYHSEGLFLFVTPRGGRLWRFLYELDGKEKLLSLGRYPDVGLTAARKLRNAAIEKVQAGTDPAAERQVCAVNLGGEFAPAPLSACGSRGESGRRRTAILGTWTSPICRQPGTGRRFWLSSDGKAAAPDGTAHRLGVPDFRFSGAPLSG